MRCSACEPLLDRYLEGSLAPRALRAATRHLQACSHCTALLAELKVVDALLLTAREPMLEPGFTRAAMAEVASLQPPRAPQHPLWSFLTLYVAAAWVGVALWIALSGGALRHAVPRASAAAAHAAGVLAAVAGAPQHALAHGTSFAVAFGVGVLLADLALALGVALVYGVVRPRLAARLATASEVSL